ncbi:hypothetical protein HanXRQr2_Chr10g0449231 [Helianthus annuus]|uniref:Uncharacterized protein n=1 Tax=Helianthus annuus TaxID=4232 RepID=A0A9K3HZ91_HELAN|nr:hypothetical protein HanXRQr2_Chr10g0449231 [Helianthus annuus]
MDTPNASNSDCELVSENEVVSKAKGKKTQRKKQDGKPPSAPQSAQTVSMKELALEQPTIIIDETVDESYETTETA